MPIHYLDQLNMHSQKIVSLGTPTVDSDATTKLYVDDAIVASITTNALVRKKPFLVGDNSSTTFVLTHNLNTLEIGHSARLVASGEPAEVRVVPTTVNTATLTTPATIILDTDELEVLIMG